MPVKKGFWLRGENREIVRRVAKGELPAVDVARKLGVSPSAVSGAVFRYRKGSSKVATISSREALMHKFVAAALDLAGHEVKKVIRELQEENRRLRKQRNDLSGTLKEVEASYRRQIASLLEKKGLLAAGGE